MKDKVELTKLDVKMLQGLEKQEKLLELLNSKEFKKCFTNAVKSMDDLIIDVIKNYNPKDTKKVHHVFRIPKMAQTTRNGEYY